MNNKIKPGSDHIGVGGGILILNKKGQGLLMKRSGKVRNEAGWWSKPGGGIDFGEMAAEAMKREMLEEIGVEVKITGYLPHTNHIIKEEGQHWIAINYIAEIVSGEPKIMEPHKCEELEWFDLDKLPEKTTQTTREPVEDYLAGRYIKF